MTAETHLPATLPVPEAARRLGISRAAAYRAARAGEIPVIRIGGRILVLRQPFDELLQGGQIMRRSRRAG